MVAGEKFSNNEEVIAKSAAYLDAKNKSHYKNFIVRLKYRYSCYTS